MMERGEEEGGAVVVEHQEQAEAVEVPEVAVARGSSTGSPEIPGLESRPKTREGAEARATGATLRMT